MDLRVISDDGDVLRIGLEGRVVRSDTVPDLAVLDEVVGPQGCSRRVAFDLSETTFIDTRCLGWLLTIHKRFNDSGGRLVHGGKEVGRFAFSGPPGAMGQKVTGGPSIAIPATPVIGKTFGEPIPTGRLTTQFTAGSVPGRYYTTFSLKGGNSVTMVVDVTDG